ncbi:MAG: DNRLRE domain-containing protein [Pseudomonadota bacterium]
MGALFVSATPAAALTVLFDEAVDTYIWGAEPTASFGAVEDITVDALDGGAETQGLLKFEDFTLPQGAEVVSASLTLYTNNPTSGTISFHTLLTPFSGTSTWNSFGGDGVQADDGEAASQVGGTLANPLDERFVAVYITEIVRHWQMQPEVFGLVMLSDSSNGWDFDSAETARGPTLTVEALAAPVPVPAGAPLLLAGLLALAAALQGAAKRLG